MLPNLTTLDVLIHCHNYPEIHPHINSSVVKEALVLLKRTGMIVQSDRHFETTPKGAFYLKYLMSIPFPVETYTIPDKE